MNKPLFWVLIIAMVGAPARAGSGSEAIPEPIRAALASTERPDADRGRDANRRPDAVLTLLGIAPEMTVLDMFAGGGYYTEILSRIVGGKGRIYSHNNLAYRQYVADQLAQRYADGRLGNVKRLDIEVEELDLRAGSVDVALLVLSYHDIYYVVDDGSWPAIDGPKMLADIRNALKPGGVLGVIDHSAKPGGDVVEIATNLHRIDKDRVICEISRAGFALTGESSVLANPDDPLDIPMFDPNIRGNTDRYVLRFEKTGAAKADDGEKPTACDQGL